MENDDDMVFIVKGVAQCGLSSGAPILESGGLRFEFQCGYLLNVSFVKVTSTLCVFSFLICKLRIIFAIIYKLLHRLFPKTARCQFF